jgi:hypothetical protein
MNLAATGHKISSVPSGKGAAAAHSRDSIFQRREEGKTPSLFVIVTVSSRPVKDKMGKMTGMTGNPDKANHPAQNARKI